MRIEMKRMLVSLYTLRFITVIFCLLYACLYVAYGAQEDKIIRWDFNSESEIQRSRNLSFVHVSDGMLRFFTGYDPCFYLRLPHTIDAQKFHLLTIRAYSSAPGGSWQIYYQSPSGDWCLGYSVSLVKGWAIYRIDLRKVKWNFLESNRREFSTRWGGSDFKVSSFRLDPGDEGGRWVMVDWVQLEGDVSEWCEGVTVEPRGLVNVSVEAPKEIRAGEKLPIKVHFKPVKPLEGSGIAFIRIQCGNQIFDVFESSILLSEDSSLHHTFSVSKFANDGMRYRIVAGIYEMETLGGEVYHDVIIHNESAGKVTLPQAQVKIYRGYPTLFLKGQPTPAILYQFREFQTRYLQEFADAGIHLYVCHPPFGNEAGPEMDFSSTDAYFARVLESVPDGYFILQVSVTPPGWWLTMNPQERCKFSDGSIGPQSLASQKWRYEIGEQLRKFVKHITNASYGDRIIGLTVCSGYTAEWQVWGIWENKFADYSEVSLNAFRNWLRERYGTVASLSRAWKDDNVTFETVRLPSSEERWKGTFFSFRNPNNERRIIDFYRYHNEIIADDIIYFCRIVKEASNKRLLAGVYYGYLTQHGIHQQDSGHLGIAKVLVSPYVDYIISPAMYTERQPGGTSTFMSAVDSVKLHGKLWIDEADLRTSLTDPSLGFGRCATLDESISVMVREFGHVLTKGVGMWWYDMHGGWFSHPQLLNAISRMKKIAEEEFQQREFFHAEIAVLIDPESFYYTVPGPINTALTRDPIVNMPRIGAPFDVYILPDIANPAMPDYRLYIFLNAFYVPKELREAIHRKLERNGAVAFWQFGAGFAENLSIEDIYALTGIKISCEPQSTIIQIKITNKQHPLAQGLIINEPIGFNEPLGPLFYSTDSDAEIVGILTANSRPGLVVKQVGKWTSVFFASVNPPVELLRNVARMAGVHIYSESGDAFYVNNHFLCIHARDGGEKEIRLPHSATVIDAITKEVISSKATSVIRFELMPHATKLLNIKFQ